MVSWLGFAIAAGLGFWAYSDAKALKARGISVWVPNTRPCMPSRRFASG